MRIGHIAVGVLMICAGPFLLTLGVAADEWPATTPLSTIPPVVGWSSGGPYVPGSTPPALASVNSIDASPAYDNDHILFAATNSGLFGSNSGGKTWELLLGQAMIANGNRFTLVHVSPTFAVDGVVFIVQAGPVAGEATLLGSADGGRQWRVVYTFVERVAALAVSPAYSADHTLFALVGAGLDLFRSRMEVELGAPIRWRRCRMLSTAMPWRCPLPMPPIIPFLPPASAACAAARTPASPGRVCQAWGRRSAWPSHPALQWTKSSGPLTGSSKAPAMATEGAVIGSADGGAHWTTGSMGLPGVYEPFPRSVAVAPDFPTDPSLFTALSGQPVALEGHDLYRSFDAGASWVTIGPGPGTPT